MRMSVSKARPMLGELCTRSQDPRAVIVLTRHGKDIAAIVSAEEVQRIWDLQNEAWSGHKCTVTGRRTGGALVLPEGMTVGPQGRIITHREAALMVRATQLRRRDERALLARGGVDPVENGEIAEEMVLPPAAPDVAEVPEEEVPDLALRAERVESRRVRPVGPVSRWLGWLWR